jgi:hypothetical protein
MALLPAEDQWKISSVSELQVELKIKWCGVKNWVGEQPFDGQFPTGLPRAVVFRFESPFLIASGTSLRLKNQMEIPSLPYSVTQTPPPAAAKGAPKDTFDGFVTMQPSLLFARWLQSVELTSVEV